MSIHTTNKQKTVFITGAEGFLGRHTARAFHQAGWYVVGLGHTSLPNSEHAAWGIDHTFRGDITPHLLVAAYEAQGPPDLLIHAAGTSSVGQAAANPYEDLELTAGSTAAVVDFIRQWVPKCLLLYISSAAVYGCGWDKPIPVSAPANPISVYGLHKHISEQLIIGAGNIYGLRYRIVRFFSLYGPELTKQLLWDVMCRIRNGERVLKLGGDGQETRDFLYVEDAAKLLITLVNASDEAPVIVNGATGYATFIKDIVALLVSEAVGHTEIEFTGETRTGDPRNLVADVSCLQRLGFASEWSIKDGVSVYAQWAKQKLAHNAN